MNSTERKKKAMLKALDTSLGIISTACKKVSITRQTHYNWIDADADYKEACKDIEESAIDFAESQLYEQIKQGNTTATIFYLKTKGRKRGYSEKVEIESTTPEARQFDVNVIIPEFTWNNKA